MSDDDPESLGPADKPWQVRNFPVELRQRFINDAKAARAEPSAHLTTVLIRAREAGLWGDGTGSATPPVKRFANDSRIEPDGDELATLAKIATMLAGLDPERVPPFVLRPLWRRLQERQRKLAPGRLPRLRLAPPK